MTSGVVVGSFYHINDAEGIDVVATPTLLASEDRGKTCTKAFLLPPGELVEILPGL